MNSTLPHNKGSTAKSALATSASNAFINIGAAYPDDHPAGF